MYSNLSQVLLSTADGSAVNCVAPGWVLTKMAQVRAPCESQKKHVLDFLSPVDSFISKRGRLYNSIFCLLVLYMIVRLYWETDNLSPILSCQFKIPKSTHNSCALPRPRPIDFISPPPSTTNSLVNARRLNRHSRCL